MCLSIFSERIFWLPCEQYLPFSPGALQRASAHCNRPDIYLEDNGNVYVVKSDLEVAFPKYICVCLFSHPSPACVLTPHSALVCARTPLALGECLGRDMTAPHCSLPCSVRCCSRAAVTVSQLCFSSQTACGNLYSFFITQGFCKQ